MQRHIVTFAIAIGLLVAVSAPFASRPGSAARDVWLKVQSKSFTLIGDAGEKEIRSVGARLEQFREAFLQISSQIFPTSVINLRSRSRSLSSKTIRRTGRSSRFTRANRQKCRDIFNRVATWRTSRWPPGGMGPVLMRSFSTNTSTR